LVARLGIGHGEASESERDEAEEDYYEAVFPYYGSHALAERHAASVKPIEDESDYYTYRRRMEERAKAKGKSHGPWAKKTDVAEEYESLAAMEWPGMDLYGASFFAAGALMARAPSPQTVRVVQDKEWVTDMLEGLEGVDPEDPRICAVLSALRGVPPML
jgi:hypothetical protein